MKIWIDGDACPKVIKEMLYRAAERRRVELIVVANKPLAVPRSPHIRTLQVAAGPDVADDRIVERLEAGDLVVTADIPLAARVIEKAGIALDPRGVLFDQENIGMRLSLRNFMDELRSSGVETGGPAGFGAADRQAFANQLDRLLTRALGNG